MSLPRKFVAIAAPVTGLALLVAPAFAQLMNNKAMADKASGSKATAAANAMAKPSLASSAKMAAGPAGTVQFAPQVASQQK